MSNCYNNTFPYKSLRTINHHNNEYINNWSLQLSANFSYFINADQLIGCEIQSKKIYIDYSGKNREFKTIIKMTPDTNLLKICENIASDKEKYPLLNPNSDFSLIITSMVMMSDSSIGTDRDSDNDNSTNSDDNNNNDDDNSTNSDDNNNDDDNSANSDDNSTNSDDDNNNIQTSIDITNMIRGFITYNNPITFNDIASLILPGHINYTLCVKYCNNFVPMEKHFSCFEIWDKEVNVIKNLL